MRITTTVIEFTPTDLSLLDSFKKEAEAAPASVAVEEPALPDPGEGFTWEVAPRNERIKADDIAFESGCPSRGWFTCEHLAGCWQADGFLYRRRKPVPPTPETEIAANWAKIAGAQLPEGFSGTIDDGVRGGEGYVAVAHMGAFMQLAMLHALMTAIHRQSGREIVFDTFQYHIASGNTVRVDIPRRAFEIFGFDHTSDLSQILAMQKAVLFALESAAWLERKDGAE